MSKEIVAQAGAEPLGDLEHQVSNSTRDTTYHL